MAESRDLALHHAASTLNLLEGLGFIVNYQKSEVTTLALPRDGISGVFDRFKRHDTPTSRRKVAKSPQKVSEIVRSNDNFYTRIVEILGPPNLLHSGNIPCSYSLQASSKAKKYNFTLPSNLRSPGCFRPASKRRDSLVERPSSCMEWPGFVSGSCRAYNRDGCLSEGVGSILRGSEDRGSLVLRRKETSHKLSQTPCMFFGNQNIHQIQSLCSCKTADGQCISSCLYKQDGGYSFPGFSETSDRSVGMVLSEIYDGVSSTSPRVLN